MVPELRNRKRRRNAVAATATWDVLATANETLGTGGKAGQRTDNERSKRPSYDFIPHTGVLLLWVEGT